MSARRLRKAYPPVPRYLSRQLVVLLVAIAAIAGAAVLGVALYLALDAGLCGTGADQHAVALRNTTLFDARGAGEPGPRRLPVYDGTFDLVMLEPPAGPEALATVVAGFPAAILLNYTTSPNRDRPAALVALAFAGDAADASAVTLRISNPSRKRIAIPEPWFDWGYWRDRAADRVLKRDIPLWLVDMEEAGRGRRGGRICAADYAVRVEIASPWFRIDPLVVRDFSGSRLEFARVSLPGPLVVDLAARSQEGAVSLALRAADVASLEFNKPPAALRLEYADGESFALVQLPFAGAPSERRCRTLQRSAAGAAYVCLAALRRPRDGVDVALAGAAVEAALACHVDGDGGLVFAASEATLSRVLAIVAPLGRGTCVCGVEAGTGRCAADPLPGSVTPLAGGRA